MLGYVNVGLKSDEANTTWIVLPAIVNMFLSSSDFSAALLVCAYVAVLLCWHSWWSC